MRMIGTDINEARRRKGFLFLDFLGHNRINASTASDGVTKLNESLSLSDHAVGIG